MNDDSPCNNNGVCWTLTVPPGVQIFKENDATTVTNQRTLVQLGTDDNSNQGEVKNPQTNRNQQIHDVSRKRRGRDVSPEEVSLLRRGDSSSSLTDDKNNISGWKLQSFRGNNEDSNDWSLQSSSLLQVTHRPAWQLLPEYTRVHVVRDKVCGVCCKTSSCSRRRVDFATDVYLTSDIQRVEQGLQLDIRGIGPCRAVRLHLRGRRLEQQHEPPPTTDLHNALQRQWDLPSHAHNFTRFTQKPDSLPLPPWKQQQDFESSIFGPILTFAVPLMEDNHSFPSSSPPLLYKVELPTNKHIAVETITVLDGCLNVDEHNSSSPSHVYIHGYQSWSYCGSIPKGQPQPTSALPNVFSGAFNQGGAPPPAAQDVYVVPDDDKHEDELVRQDSSATRSRKRGYQSDFFTCITSSGGNETTTTPQLDQDGGPALVLGWLSQHHQLGVVTVDVELHRIAMHASAVQLWKRGGCTDWTFVQLLSNDDYEEEPMVHFLHAVAAYNQAKPLHNGSLLTGWCSWYHYYENISASNLRENFQRLEALCDDKVLATNVAIVDDGYMTAWGDWDSLKPEAFPKGQGLEVVSRDIWNNGMRPGLWLAPFACDQHSQLAVQHPDWIIRNDQGRYANSSNCGKFFYGLDATNPSVRDHVDKTIRRAVEDWGYSVLKIDFLYSACLAGNGKHDLSISRAQAMHIALDTIRNAAGGNTFLIGCGCPIGSAVGYIDGMRISADTGPTWYPAFPFPKSDHGTLPSLKGMVRNSMSRACMGHRWWHNDPDCLLFGNSTKLNDTEVTSAASIVAMTCGMLLLSDDLTKLESQRQSILSKIYPMTGATAVALDLHSSKNNGMPSLLRLWCTDSYNLTFRGNGEQQQVEQQVEVKDLRKILRRDHNAAASFFGRKASFHADQPWPRPEERKRNCIHVAKGMDTWTVLSLTNCKDKAAVVNVPLAALHLESEDAYGYHVFAFWSSTYHWIPNRELQQTPQQHVTGWSKLLDAHGTEIIHVKPVSFNIPQYIGSDLHFSCGYEVRSFEATVSSVTVYLKNDWHRKGSIFLYVPRLDVSSLNVTVNGISASRRNGGWDVVANTPRHSKVPPTTCLGRILRIWVVIHANDSPNDGKVAVQF